MPTTRSRSLVSPSLLIHQSKRTRKGEIFKDNAVFTVEGVGVERSGSERRLAIYETNLFETLGGIQPFIDLSTNFYNRRADLPNSSSAALSVRWFSLMRKSGVLIYLFEFKEGGRDLEPDLFIEPLGELWHTAYFLMGGNEMTRQRQQVLNVSMQQMDHQHLPEIQLARQLTQHLHSCVYVKDAGKDVAAGFQIGGSSAYGVCTIKKSE
ncbi:hypothetical protein ZIOFF_061850 [Zingiber officinale]|uniref:Uncharacterized protein n=1 Tax=Zingiber officinale TaxID=94328 RepID=A0A8J5KIQ1_ZINOF|nr:hypothetical protein ZIOFF_061850 [Zingiber officinale]